MQPEPRHMSAHFEHHHGQGQEKPNPEAPRHVDQFMVYRRLRRDHDRLKRHAAYGTAAGSLQPDLRMHGAGEDRALRHVRRGMRAWRKMAIGTGREFSLAPCGVEMESVAGVFELMF